MKTKFTVIALFALSPLFVSCDLGYTFTEGALGLEEGTISGLVKDYKDIKKEIKSIGKDVKSDTKQKDSQQTGNSTNNTSTSEGSVTRPSANDAKVTTTTPYSRKSSSKRK